MRFRPREVARQMKPAAGKKDAAPSGRTEADSPCANVTQSVSASYEKSIASALACLGYAPEQVKVSVGEQGRQMNVTLNGVRHFIVTFGGAGVSVSEDFRRGSSGGPQKNGGRDPVVSMIRSLLEAGISPGAVALMETPGCPAR